MNKIILIALLAVSCKLIAQDLYYIKSQDTLYIVLPNLHNIEPKTEKFDHFQLFISSNGIITEYTFADKDTINHQISILVRINPTKPIQDLPIKLKRRKFLKSHEEQIISLDFIKNFKNRPFFFGYLGAKGYGKGTKTIYVVDEESLKRKDKKIILRKADIVTFGYNGI